MTSKLSAQNALTANMVLNATQVRVTQTSEKINYQSVQCNTEQSHLYSHNCGNILPWAGVTATCCMRSARVEREFESIRPNLHKVSDEGQWCCQSAAS
eukprot:COSAG02_NODE_770_length_17362_cov_42.372125_13_plen_98_part_00